MEKFLAENKSIIILLIILVVIIASLAIYINSIANTESIYSGEKLKKDDNIVYEEANEENLEKYNDEGHVFLINQVEDNYDGTLTIKGRIYKLFDGKITDEEYKGLLAGGTIEFYGSTLKIKDLSKKDNYTLVDNYGGEDYILSLDEDKNPTVLNKSEGLIRIKSTSAYMKTIVDKNTKVYTKYRTLPDLDLQYEGTVKDYFEMQNMKNGDNLDESIIYKNNYYNSDYIWLSNRYVLEFEDEKCIKIICERY